MNRQQKETVASEIKSLFGASAATFVVNYRGLTVAQVEKLRKEMRKNNAQFKVAKARLMKIATDGVQGADNLHLKDQIGLVFASAQVPPVAKHLVSFSKEHEKLKIVAGYFENKVISLSEINFLATIPPREVLLAQIAGTLRAPMQKLHGILSALVEKKTEV